MATYKAWSACSKSSSGSAALKVEQDVPWLAVTFSTRPTDRATLLDFYRKTRPGGPGWGPIVAEADAVAPIAVAGGSLGLRIAAMFVGTVAIYSILFMTGFFLYGQFVAMALSALVAIAGFGFLVVMRKRL